MFVLSLTSKCMLYYQYSINQTIRHQLPLYIYTHWEGENKTESEMEMIEILLPLSTKWGHH